MVAAGVCDPAAETIALLGILETRRESLGAGKLHTVRSSTQLAMSQIRAVKKSITFESIDASGWPD